MALLLAKLGVASLTIVEPDRVAHHNYDESLLGSPTREPVQKVIRLAHEVRRQAPGCRVLAIPHSITHADALVAVRNSDLIVLAVDRDAPRVAAAYLAAMFLRPLLDVGTGVFHSGGQLQMGGEVRLVWGERCLLCAGGVRDLTSARRELASADAEAEAWRRIRDWRAERAGSLMSLNAVTCGMAVRVLEDFVGTRLRANPWWLRLEYDVQGRLTTTHLTPPSPTATCVCAWAALGEAGLPRLAAELRRAGARADIRPAHR